VINPLSMAAIHFVWLVEKGWVADSRSRRALSSLSGSGALVKGGSANRRVVEVALESLTGPAWVMPAELTLEKMLVDAILLFRAGEHLARAAGQSVPNETITLLEDLYTKYEAAWDAIWRGKLDFTSVRDLIDEMLEVIRGKNDPVAQMVRLRFQRLQARFVMLEASGETLRLEPHKLNEVGSVVLSQPFSMAVARVTCLPELQALAPPLTSKVSAKVWQRFEVERLHFLELTTSRATAEALEVVLARTNQVLLELSPGVEQVTTKFDWSLNRIAAISPQPMWDLQSLLRDAAEHPGSLFEPVRVRVIGGLLGLAYLQAFKLAGSTCPECGMPSSPGKRGPRNPLCLACKAAHRRSSQARRTPSGR
jgi:hypothetical protein